MRTLIIICALATISCDACSQLANKFRRSDTPTLPDAQQPLLDYSGVLGSTSGGQIMAGFDVIVEAGMRLQITVESDVFDPILIVTPPGEAPRQNDDWQGSRSVSRIDLVATEAGVMKVGVTSFAANATGAYHVIVQPEPQTDDSGPLAAGQSRSGRLGPSDAQLSDGRFFQQFDVVGATDGPLNLRIGGAEGQRVGSIVMNVTGGHVLPNDDGSYVLTNASPHRVQVMSPEPQVALDYTVTLTAETGQTTPTLARDHHRLPTETTGTAIQVGQTVEGELNASDSRLPSGEPMDLFLLDITDTNQHFAINLTSTDLDPYVMVIGPSGDHWENDDSGGGTNSFLALSPPQPGRYRIAVTAYQATEQGRYTLKVLETDRQVSPDAGAVPSSVPQGASEGTIVRAGALATGDSQLRSGEFADRYPFQWPQGQNVRIRLNSPNFDPYLILRTPDGQQQDNDDLTEGDLHNSGLEHTVSQAGQHVVLVTSYRPGEQGDYTLTIDGAGAGGAGDTPPPPPNPGGSEGQTLIGELGSSDPRLPSGEFYDTREFQWSAGQAIRLEARSTAFDTYLIVRPPSGPQQDNDDERPGVTNAALSFVATHTGTYRVVVTSYRPGMQGPYELVVQGTNNGAVPSSPTPAPTPGQPEPTPTPAPPGAGESANAGDVINGALNSDDRRLRSGEFMDPHTLTFETGTSVQLRLTSTEFDPYLIVRTPGGQQLDNDDLTPSTRDAGVDIPVAEAGTYTVTVTSYRPGESGNYQLRIGSGQAVPRPGDQGGSGGRVFGVFAGISDYPAGVGDLPECANDAIKLAETLRNRGLLTTDRQILLTDSQATVGNIRNAMQQMSTQVGPEDVFIFFYSGHGGQTGSSSDSRELDGRDEYLAVYDGQLLDDEVGQLFDQLNARLSVVAIDSCHAGGLAKDIITRPGRIGLFSSEEDVLSAVASQFQAGGYLSHFLRTGMGGAADSEPNDGVLTVGELTHYLYTQFGAHAQDVHRAATYQHLVMDRGAVRVDHVMWSYR